MKKIIFAVLIMVGFTMVIGCLAADAEVGGDAKSGQPDSCQIRNVKYGDLLRPQDANGADGTRIVLYPAQPWKCMTWKLSPAGESLFQLQNHFTGKTFVSKADGTRTILIQVPLASSVNERPTWRFVRQADGSYQITDPKSGDALTATDAPDGTVRIVLAHWRDTAEQKWELHKIDPAKLTM